MNKRKHSHSETLIPPKDLIFEENRTYISPYLAQECASRLIEAERKWSWLGDSVLVNVIPRDENEFEVVLRSQARIGNGWFIGKLQPLGQTSTRVSGKCGVDPIIGFINIMALIVFAWFLLEPFLSNRALHFTFSSFIIPLIIFGLILWYSMYWLKSRVRNFLEDQLGARQIENVPESN